MSEIHYFGKEERHIAKPLCKGVIVKMLGRKSIFKALENRLNHLWARKGSIHIVDSWQHFYLVTFTYEENQVVILTDGPWMIHDHYLTADKGKWMDLNEPKDQALGPWKIVQNPKRTRRRKMKGLQSGIDMENRNNQLNLNDVYCTLKHKEGSHFKVLTVILEDHTSKENTKIGNMHATLNKKSDSDLI
ncbi:hypothetical protein KIW84_035710 [Lathyrus oleraceus]|uniref:DUF4283 domain-containing protein n=1 Tax=Pisum sativum TaxID=3888 RepID=A0A9D4Y2A8_PEA|nr:hypothetical protein KIW84_035710 [Pisum sativum]